MRQHQLQLMQNKSLQDINFIPIDILKKKSSFTVFFIICKFRPALVK